MENSSNERKLVYSINIIDFMMKHDETFNIFDIIKFAAQELTKNVIKFSARPHQVMSLDFIFDLIFLLFISLEKNSHKFGLNKIPLHSIK